jgi:hypothetical protein
LVKDLRSEQRKVGLEESVNSSKLAAVTGATPETAAVTRGGSWTVDQRTGSKSSSLRLMSWAGNISHSAHRLLGSSRPIKFAAGLACLFFTTEGNQGDWRVIVYWIDLPETHSDPNGPDGPPLTRALIGGAPARS